MNNERNSTNLYAYVLLTCLLTLVGCAKQQRYATIDQISISNIDKTESMQIAEDVLAKMHFTIEKADYENGIIKTRPLPGAQFFEFWRSDNVGASNTLEANIHSIRRIVELHINQAATDRLSIDCNVQVQRLNLPIPRKSDEPLPSQNLEKLTRTAKAEWADLDKDTKLATRILKRIEKQIRNSKSETRNKSKIQMSK